MANNNFWNEASRCGAIVGLTNVAFSAIGMFIPSISFVASLVNFVVTIYLLFHFTRRRSLLFIKTGYTYSESLGFIVAMGMFAGIISGIQMYITREKKTGTKISEAYNKWHAIK